MEIANLPHYPMPRGDYEEWVTSLEEKVLGNGGEKTKNGIANGLILKEAITPGIYIRELTMEPGMLVFSKIHLQRHPFVVTEGSCSVYDGNELLEIKAPYKGITTKGTKRVLVIHEKTVWTTFHPIKDETIEDCNKDCVIACSTFDQFHEIQRVMGRLENESCQ